jgi:hypothetical protein
MNKKEIYYGLTTMAIWLVFCFLVGVFIDGSASAPWVMFAGFLASKMTDAIRVYFL